MLDENRNLFGLVGFARQAQRRPAGMGRPRLHDRRCGPRHAPAALAVQKTGHHTGPLERLDEPAVADSLVTQGVESPSNLKAVADAVAVRVRKKRRRPVGEPLNDVGKPVAVRVPRCVGSQVERCPWICRERVVPDDGDDISGKAPESRPAPVHPLPSVAVRA